MQGQSVGIPDGEIKVSFGYQCNVHDGGFCMVSNGCETQTGSLPRTSSFSCLSGAGLSANATLANTNICNGLLGAEILPSIDSPNSFRRVPSSPTVSRLDMLSSSLQSSASNLSCSAPSSFDPSEYDSFLSKSTIVPSTSDGFLNSMEVQVAGGAAGEDRVQAVCSEENGWLFCAIYDGFNGRDAADFLAGTLYETVLFNCSLLEKETKQDCFRGFDGVDVDGPIDYIIDDNNIDMKMSPRIDSSSHDVASLTKKSADSADLFRQGVADSLQLALCQAENDFLYMVEQEMEDRPDLVSVGTCVLVVLLHGNDLHTLNLGDSRAVLATYSEGDSTRGIDMLKAIQLTDCHTVDNEVERTRLLHEHPDDSTTIMAGKVKGKLKVTRAIGVGYLKKEKLNDALMGILQVHNLVSPPYVSAEPSINVHKITKSDSFVIVGSDGLFDFFSNEEAVKLVNDYILNNPCGDPAKHLIEELVVRAAHSAGFSQEELLNIPAGRRRKYHDDVTVMVIMLGIDQRTSKASTCI